MSSHIPLSVVFLRDSSKNAASEGAILSPAVDRSYDRIKNFEKIYRQDGAYHRDVQGFKSWFLRANYTAIARECRRHDRVLDLACGEGCLGPYLKVKRLIGVDYSREALGLNRRLHPGLYHELHWADMRRLDELELPRSSFDVIVCSLSLMYLVKPDLAKCLRGVRHFLVPRGVFVCTYPTVGPHRAANPEAAELHPEELLDELSGAGFTIERCQPICPLIPADDVRRSEVRETRNAAYSKYWRAKKRVTMETSYHFLCRARRR